MLQIETNAWCGRTKRPHASPWGIRMRPTGGMQAGLGHEQAGLRDVLVPVRARLGIALLGLKVDVEQAVALVVAVGP